MDITRKKYATRTVLAVVAIAAGLQLMAEPAHRRRFPRTVYLTEIPLVTTYSNGNPWMGWTGRWIDWPLMVDRSLEYVEGYQYRVTWPGATSTS